MSKLSLLKTKPKQKCFQFNQGSSSPSRSTTSRVTARSMASTSATCCAPATWTPPSRPSPNWEVRPRRERSSWRSTTSTLSSRKPRTPRTPVASTISLKSWSCTTRMRTAPSSRTSSSDCWPISVSHSNFENSYWKNNLQKKLWKN